MALAKSGNALYQYSQPANRATAIKISIMQMLFIERQIKYKKSLQLNAVQYLKNPNKYSKKRHDTVLEDIRGQISEDIGILMDQVRALKAISKEFDGLLCSNCFTRGDNVLTSCKKGGEELIPEGHQYCPECQKELNI